MSLDTSGRLLEGIRTSTGNNSFTFPPRTYISDEVAFEAKDTRAEYAIIVGSLDSSKNELEIADPDLIFYYTKNESVVIRFDYDSFGRRFFPSPGGAPNELGIIENSPRLVMPVPDLTLISAPIDVYIGDPTRVITFNLSAVPTDGDFTNPSTLTSGNLEISEETGYLNFSNADISSYANQTVIATRQSFSNRTQTKGIFGELPQSSSTDYHFFLNPKPATGQTPLVRIDYRRHLTAVEVPTESALGSPTTGTFHWSLDTGRVRFATTDIDDNAGRNVYYDGAILGSRQLSTTTVGAVVNSYPAVAFTIPGAIGITDSSRFIISAELSGVRHYFSVALINIASLPTSAPAPGSVYLETTTGSVLMSVFDLIIYSGWSFSYTDSVISIEDGVSIQFYRSGVNGSRAPVAADFTVLYQVENQIIQSGIIASPFVVLPTIPVIDSDLKFSIAQVTGSVGSFVGELVDGTDSTQSGNAYLLDLDNLSVNFAERKTSTKLILRPVSTIKLDDGAVSELGFEATQAGNPIVPGVDFDFDPIPGIVDFVQPVGENNPDDISGISGTVSSSLVGLVAVLNRFTADSAVFTAAAVGKYLFVQAGTNVGVYKITTYVSPTTVKVSPNFEAAGSTTADLRTGVEVIADRFWAPFLPPFKKFSLSKAESGSNIFTALENTEFNVFKNVGQVNIDEPTKPGERFQINYISQDSEDNGVTVTPTNRVEKALFKVRQETATVPTSGDTSGGGFIRLGSGGSRTATFNPGGNTVNTARPIDVYRSGLPLDQEDFTFEPPGTLRFVSPIFDDETIIVDYWIEEATGNDSNFDLLYSPIDLDTPEVVEGEIDATFNGDQRGLLFSGSAILIDSREVVIVDTVTYDSTDDTTIVQFETAPAISSEGAQLQATEPITGSYRTTETNAVDVFSQGSNQLSIAGDVSDSYPAGTVITVDGDAYLSQSVQYDPNRNQTTVSLVGQAKRNYIIPTVTRTIRPVLSATSSFQTKTEANLNFPFTLVKMGNERSVLIQGVDYTVADGGMVQLSTDIEFGDSLYAMYVGRTRQSAPTSFTFNYAYAIAPNEINGLLGQKLLASYNLYAPDSFFYRVETVETFIPEVTDLLSSGSQTSSGPNIGDVVTSATTKDSGIEGPYFEEKHQNNLDITIARLLKFYNDLVNIYEDILSDLDGRIVGGNNGRFRFDGNFDNPVRASYSAITNDIDDQSKLYDTIVLTGFFSFDIVPVYGRVGEPNSLSRIFPTVKNPSAALNDQVSFDYLGQPLGSLGVENIQSATSMISARGRSLIDSVTNGLSIVIPKNGDAENLVPEFETGQKVTVYGLDGTPDVTGSIVSVTGSEPATIVIDTFTSLTSGSLLRNVSDPTDATVSFYTVGKDLLVNPENGQIINFTLPPPLAGLQNPVIGNEIIDAALVINNTDISPLRIPVLDGEELNDDGKIPAPIIKRVGESNLLEREKDSLSRFGNAKVSSGGILITDSTVTVAVGNSIEFIAGPNVGIPASVATVINPASFTISPALPFTDTTGSDFIVSVIPGDDLVSILAEELKILDTNTEIAPAAPAQVGTIDSELLSTENAILSLGDTISSGIGTTTATVLTDTSANFTADGVDDKSLLYVPNGSNRGLFKVDSATATQVTIDDTSPYAAFPASISTPYVIIQKSDLISDAGPEFLTEFLRETLDFLNKTQTFAANPSTSDIASRTSDVDARLAQINDFTVQLSGILADEEKFYDIRYLWIDQRTNRKEGTFVKKLQAVSQRQENIQKIINDQQKLLVVSKITA